MRDPSYLGASRDYADATCHSGPALAASHAKPRGTAETMNIVLALTFGEEIAKDVIGALATGLFVALGGGVAAAILTRSWEARRQNFELKTGLVEKAWRSAQKMFVACQHTRRILRGNPDATTRAEALAALDETYREFSPDNAVLETILGVRYGMSSGPGVDGTVGTPSGKSVSNVVWRWHQVGDLLTAYYFNLKGEFPGDALERNTKGHEGKFHSGLNLKGFVADKNNPSEGELKAMRPPIRSEYEIALAALAKAVMTESIKTR